MKQVRALLLAIGLAATACSSDSDSTAEVEAESPTSTVSSTTAADDQSESSETTTEAPAPSSSLTPATDPIAVTADSLSSSLGAALDLVVGWFNGQSLDEATYQTLFNRPFQAAVPYEQFTATNQQLSAAGPWTLGEIVSSTDTEVVVVLSNEDGDSVQLTVGVEDTENVVIHSLFYFTP